MSRRNFSVSASMTSGAASCASGASRCPSSMRSETARRRTASVAKLSWLTWDYSIRGPLQEGGPLYAQRYECTELFTDRATCNFASGDHQAHEKTLAIRGPLGSWYCFRLCDSPSTQECADQLAMAAPSAHAVLPALLCSARLLESCRFKSALQHPVRRFKTDLACADA